MYKLMFIDLDGTLLNDKKEISEENVKWLNRAYEEKGITTIITTGRQLGFVKDLYKKYNCCFGDYIISCDGAIIKNIKTGEYINKEIFSKEEVKELRKKYLNEALDFFLLYTEDDAYLETNQKEKIYSNVDYDKFGRRHVENIVSLFEKNPNFNGALCVIGGKENKIKNVIKSFDQFSNVDHTPICTYTHEKDGIVIKSTHFDIMKKGVNKKNAIKKVIKKFNINYDEIVVIGDGGNDLSMFEQAKLKIAMANADEELKKNADYITDTNNNDGVAKAIKKFIY